MRYNNKNQSWCLVTETYEVEVSYNYYFDSGDYYQPPEEDFEREEEDKESLLTFSIEKHNLKLY